MRYAREVFALTAVVFGCGGRPSGAVACCAAPDVASASHGGDAGIGEPADAEASAAFPDALRFRREEGCARTLAPSGDRDQDLLVLGKLCAAGLVPVEVETKSLLRVPAGRIVDVPFTLLTGNACLRAAAVASRGGLSVALYRGDRLLGSAISAETVVVTPPDGPVCVREPGVYRAAVVVGATPDASSDPVGISLRIWQATGD